MTPIIPSIYSYTDKSSGRSEISFSRLPCTKVSKRFYRILRTRLF